MAGVEPSGGVASFRDRSYSGPLGRGPKPWRQCTQLAAGRRTLLGLTHREHREQSDQEAGKTVGTQSG